MFTCICVCVNARVHFLICVDLFLSVCVCLCARVHYRMCVYLFACVCACVCGSINHPGPDCVTDCLSVYLACERLLSVVNAVNQSLRSSLTAEHVQLYSTLQQKKTNWTRLMYHSLVVPDCHCLPTRCVCVHFVCTVQSVCVLGH